MNRRLELALHPPPEVGRFDTGLRYTDILFGLVIRELFSRLQNWSLLGSAVRWHLVVGTTLVLGSWIGYRRSLNRTAYEVKFFNLPLLRWLVDQLMLVLYFRVATLTDLGGGKLLTPDELATTTSTLVLYVFVLYIFWDFLGIWMASASIPGEPAASRNPRYPKLGDEKSTKWQSKDWPGLLITLSTLVLVAALRSAADRLIPEALLIIMVVLLAGYRLAKEVRTSWRSH